MGLSTGARDTTEGPQPTARVAQRAMGRTMFRFLACLCMKTGGLSLEITLLFSSACSLSGSSHSEFRRISEIVILRPGVKSQVENTGNSSHNLVILSLY